MDWVTDRNALHWPMEDEKSTRFAQWKAGLVAGSHVLTKAVGDTILARWDVTNTGGVSAQGFLDIFFPDLGTAFTGTTVTMLPGATVGFLVSGLITTLPTGAHRAQVRVRALSPATVGPGGTHDFTLTISPSGAILSASPDGPVIN